MHRDHNCTVQVHSNAIVMLLLNQAAPKSTAALSGSALAVLDTRPAKQAIGWSGILPKGICITHRTATAKCATSIRLSQSRLVATLNSVRVAHPAVQVLWVMQIPSAGMPDQPTAQAWHKQKCSVLYA